MINRYSIILLVLLVILNFSNLLSQEIKFKGQIVDKENNNALQFATIEIFSLKTGVVTDYNGSFSITIPDISHLNDTIRISYLGYSQIRTTLNSLSLEDDNIIKLEKKAIVLKEVTINPKDLILKKIGVTIKKNKGNWHLGNPGDQHAIFIKNEFGKPGVLKNVSFYITDKGFPSAPFRIRIYSFDKLKKAPGYDLLNQNMIVNFDRKKNGWFTIDVSKFHIEFPSEGIFVAMEWIYTKQEYYYTTPMKSKSGILEDVKCYGQTIGLSDKQPEVLYWRRYLGTEWYHMKFGNAMINAEIEFGVDKK